MCAHARIIRLWTRKLKEETINEPQRCVQWAPKTCDWTRLKPPSRSTAPLVTLFCRSERDFNHKSQHTPPHCQTGRAWKHIKTGIATVYEQKHCEWINEAILFSTPVFVLPVHHCTQRSRSTAFLSHIHFKWQNLDFFPRKFKFM